MERKTVLYDCHVALNAKIVPFAGYLMPIQYETGVIKEHNAVRTAAGLFDVSHMGEVFVQGENAEKYLQKLLANDMSDLQDNTCRYSTMCNENGGVIDDLLVYKFQENVYLLVVNASNREKDFEWMGKQVFEGVSIKDDSEGTAELALQGPKAEEILKKIVQSGALPQKNYTFIPVVNIAGIDCLVSRTGYTGEDGFELYCNVSDAVALWNAILETGKEQGLVPCGLAARDTLRLEAGMPLYGHEMNEEINPLEAGLAFSVKMNKEDFIGRSALEKMGELKRKRVGLKITGRGIAREEAKVFDGEQEIGVVTSGTHLPFVGYAGAMALVLLGYTEVGTKLEVDVRGRRIEAEVIKLPFYKANK